jgi:alpha-1,6-mannosyltransferase
MITLGCWLASVVAMLLVAALGPSAAVPDIPGSGRWPPYSLAAGPPAGLVFALEGLAIVAGAVAAWRMLAPSPGGRDVDPRWLYAGGCVAALVLTFLPPIGGDITNYLAYGHEAAGGINPYTHGPQSPGVPQSPLTQAVDPPWQTTPSVYGPAFTGLSAVIARAAPDGHLAVTATRAVFAAAFVLTGLVLWAVCRTDAGRRRAAAAFTANPLVLFTLIAAAHVDVLVAAAVVGSLALVRRLPLAAGALLGLGAMVKVTALLALPGLLWVVLGRRRSWPAVLLGVAVVAVPWLAATPEVLTQLRAASRFTTPAAPWRVVAWLLQHLLGHDAARSVVGVLATGVGLAVIVLLLRRGLPPSEDTAVARAAAVTAAIALGWLLTAPYVLPWYDALAWAPLALVGASFLDRVLVVHTAVLAIAFLPGRDLPLAGVLDGVHRVLHSGLSPLVLAVLVVVTVRLALRHRPAGVHVAALEHWGR